MLVSDLLNHINDAFRATDDDAPTAGTDDHSYWLRVINRKVSEWAKDSKIAWASNFKAIAPNEPGTVATTGTTTLTGTSTYFTDYRVGDTILVDGETVRTIATITSDTVLTVTVAFSNTVSAETFTHTSIIAVGVQTYNLHRSFFVPSDKAIVTNTQDIEYVVTKPQSRNIEDVYIHGMNPQKITFYADIETGDNSIGGSLAVPGYYVPDALTANTDVVSVDDPYWLVYAVASDLALNDLTYASKSPNLNAQANALYQAMARANRAGTYGNPRKVPTNVTRIGSDV